MRSLIIFILILLAACTSVVVVTGQGASAEDSKGVAIKPVITSTKDVEK
jgi:hypothetical protein